VQVGLLINCFCSIAVATIGYVVAMLLVKIKQEEVGGRVKFARRAGLPDPSIKIVFAKQGEAVRSRDMFLSIGSGVSVSWRFWCADRSYFPRGGDQDVVRCGQIGSIIGC
jgi:hypothetical protein